MKKICIAALLLICFLLAALQVFAHPGGTDEDGGHYVNGTSEYHYHHGYPAHDHYDMDGDGDKDCPYDFDDKTGRNSGNSTTTKTTGSYSSGYTKPKTSSEAPEAPDSGRDWTYDLSGPLSVALLVLSAVSGARKKDCTHKKVKE